MPITWVSKRQNTVETSTWGSKLVAARVAVDMVVASRYKLRMLGIKVEETSVLLGDNMSVVVNTSIPSSPLSKKHQACNWHRIREAITAGIIVFSHIESTKNIADVLTKPLAGPLFHELIEPYLFRNL